jgi:hypothetical protein
MRAPCQSIWFGGGSHTESAPCFYDAGDARGQAGHCTALRLGMTVVSTSHGGPIGNAERARSYATPPKAAIFARASNSALSETFLVLNSGFPAWLPHLKRLWKRACALVHSPKPAWHDENVSRKDSTPACLSHGPNDSICAWCLGTLRREYSCGSVHPSPKTLVPTSAANVVYRNALEVERGCIQY